MPDKDELTLNIDLSSNVTEPPSWFDDVSKLADRWIHQQSPWTGARLPDGNAGAQIIRSDKDAIRQFAMVKVPKKPEEDLKRPDVLNPNTALILQAALIKGRPIDHGPSTPIEPSELGGPEKVNQGLVLIPQAAWLAREHKGAGNIAIIAAIGSCQSPEFQFTSSGCGSPPVDCITPAPIGYVQSPGGYGGAAYDYQSAAVSAAGIDTSIDEFAWQAHNANVAIALPSLEVLKPDGPLGGGVLTDPGLGNIVLTQGTDGPQGTSAWTNGKFPLSFDLALGGTNPDFPSFVDTTNNLGMGTGYFPLLADCPILAVVATYNGGPLAAPIHWAMVDTQTNGICNAALYTGVIPAGETQVIFEDGIVAAGVIFAFPRLSSIAITSSVTKGHQEAASGDATNPYDLTNTLLAIQEAANGDKAVAVGNIGSGPNPAYNSGDHGAFVSSEGGSGAQAPWAGGVGEISFSSNSNWAPPNDAVPWYTTVINDLTNLSVFLDSGSTGVDLNTVQIYYSTDGGGSLTMIPMIVTGTDGFGVTHAQADGPGGGSLPIGMVGPGVTFSFWANAPGGNFNAAALITQGHSPEPACATIFDDWIGWMVGINP